jgi:spore coat polysaccharide biosynthesis predicted glycosyltransferase SpsG
VQALMAELGDIELDVVLGAGAASLEQLSRLAGADRRVRLHVDVAGMQALMSSADVAVGAGGSATWERACLGLPSLSLILADNQRAMTRDLDAAGLTLAAEAQTGDLTSTLIVSWRRLIGDGALRMRLAQGSAAICDGLGAERVADAIEAL